MKQSKGLNGNLKTEHKKTKKQDHDVPEHRKKPTDLDLHCLSLNMWISI